MMDKNNRKNTHFEEYETGLWKFIMQNYAEHEGKELEEKIEALKDDPQYQPSDAERKRYRKMLDKELWKNKFRSVVKISKKILPKVAIFLFVLMLGFIITFTTVEAFREVVMNFILTFNIDNVEVSLPIPTPLQNYDKEAIFAKLEEINNDYTFTELPSGYVIIDVIAGNNYSMCKYSDRKDGFVEFYECDSAGAVDIDTENADIIKNIKINGNDGIFVLKKNVSTVSWDNGDKAFIIRASISEDEIIKMAESVITVKEWREDFESKLQSQNKSTDISGGYAPAYVPAGYRIENVFDNFDFRVIEYINDSDDILTFNVYGSSSIVSIDDEDADEIKDITINGRNGTYIRKKDRVSISWDNGDIKFVLMAHLPVMEVIKIAESVTFIEATKPEYDISGGYAPTYIPNGYWIDELSEMGDNGRIILYKNDEDNLIDFLVVQGGTLDNENAEVFKNIEINGITGIYILKKNAATVSWANDEKIFILQVRPPLPEKEIIKMAESVMFIGEKKPANSEGEKSANPELDLYNMYVPMYIPEGYWIDNVVKANIDIIFYKNDYGHKMDFTTLKQGDNLGNLDSEEAEIFKNIEVNGITGIYMLKNNIATMSWTNSEGSKVFILYANPQLPEEEMMKIAESVVFVE